MSRHNCIAHFYYIIHNGVRSYVSERYVMLKDDGKARHKNGINFDYVKKVDSKSGKQRTLRRVHVNSLVVEKQYVSHSL